MTSAKQLIIMDFVILREAISLKIKKELYIFFNTASSMICNILISWIAYIRKTEKSINLIIFHLQGTSRGTLQKTQRNDDRAQTNLAHSTGWHGVGRQRSGQSFEGLLQQGYASPHAHEAPRAWAGQPA